ncbi:TRAP transporter substrate-binding protein DctP [Pseudoalteromonas sp. C2R02]|uniref:TRAP transporter substrate-binding protein n=1 Tax=Pseudoalteromonas sp. C2R02 TaxID=2841565 RepID=UPI001C07FBAE|nr:TRAP transporter substrate-binding protein DctP [Pseudoalteromonas sp. C2R02]MBU2972552.1 TRAP transporter substrate-binding protein DctP [Pseudoalteromonas sp. C2R02]
MQIKRRHFIRSSFAIGAVTALYSQYPSLSFANNLLESEKKAQAKFTLVFASPYDSSQSQYTPHMHLEFKQNIETMSQGKIYVDIQDKGRLGIGTELMAAVNRGHVSAALISVSNLSRALPILDILNIPFWAADNQAYLNLISSGIWQNLVLDNIKNKSNLEVLFHYIPGPRTLSTTKNYNKVIKRPEDLNHVVFRVPASKVLTEYYKMTGANVVSVPWSETARLSRIGQIQALDPGFVGLYSGPEQLKSSIGTVSTISSVQDAWVSVINQAWLNNLPTELKLIVKQASEATFKQHLKSIESNTQNCINGLLKAGSKIYQPTHNELEIWRVLFGHHQVKWIDVKKQLLGDLKTFDMLLAATKQTSDYLI